MAQYTVELKDIMKSPISGPKLNKALSTYPLYVKKSKESYIPSYVPTREQLNNKILNHYKYREIGFETVGRFLDELEIAMIEIMPKYNHLFFSADQDFNIIYNVDYAKTITSKRDGENTSKATSTNENTVTDEGSTKTDTMNTAKTEVSGTNKTTNTSNNESSTTTSSDKNSKNVVSQTPQGQINITASNIDNIKYADQVQWNKEGVNEKGTTSSNGSSTTNVTDSETRKSTDEISNKTSATNTQSSLGKNTGNATDTHTQKEEILESTKGNFGVVSAQDLILKYRETIINIEQMIINDIRISELFMNVF